MVSKVPQGFRIGSVEFFYMTGPHKDFSISHCMTGCIMFSLYWVGFTLLRGDCKNVS